MTITKAHLQLKVDYLNRITGNPVESTLDVLFNERDGGRYTANVGNYHLGWAYGGVKLQQIVNTGGGCHDVFNYRFTKPELARMIDAFIKGIECGSSRVSEAA